MNRNLMAAVALAAGSVSILSGCANIVRKPEVDVVKKVAIISVYTNSTINKVGGGGKNGGGAHLLSKLAGKEDGSTPSARTRIAQYALDTYTKELGRVAGWQIVSADTVVASSAYKDMGKLPGEAGQNRALASVAGALTTLQQATFVTPPKMWAIQMKDGETKHADSMTKLCKSLGVDAVAVVQLDLGYESSFALGGTGTAKASVASSMKMFTREGKYAVAFPEIQPGQGSRYESDDTAMMLGGNISIDNNEKIFQQAINKAAYATRETIVKELAKK